MNDKDWNDFLIGQATGVAPPGSIARQQGAYVHKLHNPPPRLPSYSPKQSKGVATFNPGTDYGAAAGRSLAKGLGELLIFAVVGFLGYLIYQGWFTDARIEKIEIGVRSFLYFGVMPVVSILLLVMDWNYGDRTLRDTLRWLAITVLYGAFVWLGVAYALGWLSNQLELPPPDVSSFSLGGSISLVLIGLPTAAVTASIVTALRNSFGTHARPWQLFLVFGPRRRAKIRNELSVLLRDGKGNHLTSDVWRNDYLANVLFRFIYWRTSAYYRRANHERLIKIASTEFRRAARSSGIKSEVELPNNDEVSGNHGAFLSEALESASLYHNPRFTAEFAKTIKKHVQSAHEKISNRSNTTTYEKALLERYWYPYLKKARAA